MSSRKLSEFPAPKQEGGKPGRWGYLACESGLLLGSLVDAEHVVTHTWRPADMSELVTFFGTQEIAFGAERSGFSIAAADLDRPLSTSDPALHALVGAYAEGELDKRGKPGGGGGNLAPTLQTRTRRCGNRRYPWSAACDAG